ncbi:Uncharacterized [Syntrophomonas zehnderi OL-4]|uniref:Uncharacterized n=1 Tax=Syntrophomonas zehnderi OL-4 TaxID=690567 RepID=A0A0E4C7E4_9FIRM|nr:hypothetical protein [Syntrophomonas zehnderi]CFW96149.1 Uncharacterized [Syntrophomonas zehnderi OL-4]
MYFEEDTIWMSQKNLAQLYQTSPQNITMHIKNIYTAGELLEEITCKEFVQVQNEGGRQVERITQNLMTTAKCWLQLMLNSWKAMPNKLHRRRNHEVPI